MMTNVREDSTSSEDEILKEALREATDQQFLKTSLFQANTPIQHTPENEQEIETKPSLRNSGKVDSFEDFGVSQTFKDFVAKKLSAILDSEIVVEDEQLTKKKLKRLKKKRKTRENTSTGVKLLSTSGNILSAIIAEESSDARVRKRVNSNLQTSDDKINNKARCKEAAVDPDWVLSKCETKSWNERQKGIIYKYKKMSDGTLVEQ